MQPALLRLAVLLLTGALSAQATEFVGSLTGAQEVPPSGSIVPGEIQVTLDTTTNTAAFRMVTGTFATAPTAAHFHRAAVGVSGPVVITLTGGPTVWAGVTRVLTAAEITDLRAGLWYANVHTGTFPNGEIRGQLGAAVLPVTFGAGCVGSNTRTPTIVPRSFACANNSVFQISLTNAKENSLAFLLVGNSKTQYLTLTLPFDLSVIGMIGCTAYCNDVGLGGPGTSTDTTGSAYMPIFVPFMPQIVGLTLYSQWYVIDPGANIMNITSSNALDWKIQ